MFDLFRRIQISFLPSWVATAGRAWRVDCAAGAVTVCWVRGSGHVDVGVAELS